MIMSSSADRNNHASTAQRMQSRQIEQAISFPFAFPLPAGFLSAWPSRNEEDLCRGIPEQRGHMIGIGSAIVNPSPSAMLKDRRDVGSRKRSEAALPPSIPRLWRSGQQQFGLKFGATLFRYSFRIPLPLIHAGGSFVAGNTDSIAAAPSTVL